MNGASCSRDRDALRRRRADNRPGFPTKPGQRARLTSRVRRARPGKVKECRWFAPPELRNTATFVARAETLGLRLLFTPPRPHRTSARPLFRVSFPHVQPPLYLPSGAFLQFVRGRQARARPEIPALSHGGSFGGRNGKSRVASSRSWDSCGLSRRSSAASHEKQLGPQKMLLSQRPSAYYRVRPHDKTSATRPPSAQLHIASPAPLHPLSTTSRRKMLNNRSTTRPDCMPGESPDGKRQAEDAGRVARHRVRDCERHPQDPGLQGLLHRVPDHGGARDPLFLHPVPDLRGAQGTAVCPRVLGYYSRFALTMTKLLYSDRQLACWRGQRGERETKFHVAKRVAAPGSTPVAAVLKAGRYDMLLSTVDTRRRRLGPRNVTINDYEGRRLVFPHKVSADLGQDPRNADVPCFRSQHVT